MTPRTPREVLRTIAADLKIQGISHAVAAEKLGISKQTFANLLSTNKYFTERQAEKFHKAFGYNNTFLISGEGPLSPYYENQNNPVLNEIIINRETKKATIVDDTQKGDIELMLYWIHEVFSRQNNKEGLAVWAEVSRFSQAKTLVTNSMRGYKGNNFQQEYEERLTNLQSEIIESIEQLIESIKKDS